MQTSRVYQNKQKHIFTTKQMKFLGGNIQYFEWIRQILFYLFVKQRLGNSGLCIEVTFSQVQQVGFNWEQWDHLQSQ